MDTFSSIFEIFVGFNFAFILSDNFTLSLLNSIVGSFKFYISNNITDLYNTINSLEEYVVDKKKDRISEQNINSLLENIKQFKDKISSVEKEIKNFVKDNSSFSAFRVYCLFGGLYSLFILFIIGLNLTNVETCYGNKFLVFNVFSTIFNFAIFIILPIFKIRVRYFWILLVFTCAGIISSVSYSFLYEFNVSYYKYINLVFAFGLSIIHFVFYFIKILFTSFFPSRNFKNELEKLSNEVKELESNIKAQISGALNQISSKD